MKAKDTLAGRVLPCPKCGEKLEIPQPEPEPAGYTLQPAPEPEPPPPEPESVSPEEPDEAVPPESPPKRPARSLPPLTAREIPSWLRHLHWALVLALIPLAFSLLYPSAGRDEMERILRETLEKATEEEQERVAQVMEDIEENKASAEKLFSVLPRQRLAGAALPRNTWLHWLFGAGAAVLFMGFFLLLSTHNTAEPLHLLAIGLFTATVGIVFLLIVQMLATLSQGLWLRGGGIIIVLFYIIFSYQAALDPSNGFFLSFLGYTFGVGFCEEVVKALPLLWLYRRPVDSNWRTAFLWGLASGAGFGIAEGIMYSSSFYNGISGAGIYLVRFVSCVALHALWTGSVGITLNQKQGLMQQQDHWYEYIPPLFLIVGVPMVLHGLYDTFLKKEMNGAALGVAVLSFLYLAFQISRLHGADDEAATKAMLREYKRRRLDEMS
jgi:RsiW-degrading membrane proteinase PrsW (M82 family)